MNFTCELFVGGQSGTHVLGRPRGEGVAGGVRWNRATQVSGGNSCGWSRRQHRLGPVEDVHLMASLIPILLELGEAPKALKAMLPSAYRGSRLTSEPVAPPRLLSLGQEGEYGEDTWDHEAQMEEEAEEEEVDELMAS
ncbi:hypothetical protein EYF80_012333 [Liparis tanakae]|uniref:Uncharacterized protein n=1 Tax=Liparis tanakae TaxID=230148 RepID=A0A4Z2IHN4_9TELE|nr:hypothetical protein EYF80_012333 [Liparis tanakae]